MSFSNILLEYNWLANNMVRTLLFISIAYFLVYIVHFIRLIIANSQTSETFLQLDKLRELQDQRDRKNADALTKGVAPVLYLRPFFADGSRITQSESVTHPVKISGVTIGEKLQKLTFSAIQINKEIQLAQLVERIGPFITLEGDENYGYFNFGATRITSNKYSWRQQIMDYMNSACMIVVRVEGPLSENLEWEIDNLINKYLAKTIFYITIKNEIEYKSFLRSIEKFNLLFPPYKYFIINQDCLYLSFSEKKKRFKATRLEVNDVYKKCKALKKSNKKTHIQSSALSQ